MMARLLGLSLVNAVAQFFQSRIRTGVTVQLVHVRRDQDQLCLDLFAPSLSVLGNPRFLMVPDETLRRAGRSVAVACHLVGIRDIPVR